MKPSNHLSVVPEATDNDPGVISQNTIHKFAIVPEKMDQPYEKLTKTNTDEILRHLTQGELNGKVHELKRTLSTGDPCKIDQDGVSIVRNTLRLSIHESVLETVRKKAKALGLVDLGPYSPAAKDHLSRD
jgi:hypothetical protein